MKLYIATVVAALLVFNAGAQGTRENSRKNNGKDQQKSSGDKGKGWSNKTYKRNWTVKPFDLQVFVENRGQFDTAINGTDRVLFQAQLGKITANFTSKGIVYRYDDYPKTEPTKSDYDPDEYSYGKPKTSYLKALWEGANPNVTLEAKEEQTYFNAYPVIPNGTIRANVFKKITYKNIYPGIDIEYTFPEGKMGLKYVLIVHPGADLSKVKLKYDGAKELRTAKQGNIGVVTNGMRYFVDHAPVSYYKEDHKPVQVEYKINKKTNEESFYAKSLDNTKTLAVDPWSVDPTLGSTSGYDYAYDLDYDNNGNIYAYGSYSPYRLTKLNSSGIIQWQFVATIFSGTWHYYGDMACDKPAGVCYLVEGCYNITGARILKVSTGGALLGTFPGDPSMREMWRATENSCDRTIVIGGGGTNSGPYNAFVLDTTLSKVAAVNTTGATSCCHDVCLVTTDPTGSSCYMGLARTSASSSADNVIIKSPLPTLTPNTWMMPDFFAFQEAFSPTYVGPGAGTTNGMNGLAASPNWLYAYEGDTLERFNKTTGVLSSKVSLGSTGYSWGGLDVDACDNVYAGYQSSIYVYNSSLSLTGTIPQTNTVYDVVLGNNYKVVYACGKAFVSSDSLAGTPVTITKTKTPTNCSLCNGTATATLAVCGTATTPNSYLWSNGQTTSTATGLCPGTYTVTMATGCGVTYQDTVNILKSGSASFTISKSANPSACTSSTGSATITSVTGGTSPYTYAWSNGKTTSTITGLSSGTYCVTINDAGGCSDSACIFVPNSGGLTATINPVTNVLCFGDSNGTANASPSGGTSPYTYSWSNGQSSQVATNLKVGSYTVTITDVNGCTINSIISITSPPALTLTASGFNATCNGTCNGSATVIPAGGTGSYTYNWSNGATTAGVTGLCAGSYTCTVNDGNGCKHDTIFTLTGSAALTWTKSDSAASCGLANGSATVTITGGGTSPFTYNWSNGSTSSNLTGVAPGTYTDTIKDANGCKDTVNIIIRNLASDTITFGPPVNVLCNGASTGSLNVTVKGGSTPYNYVWSPSGGTNTTATGLSAGTYTLTVTDNTGCKNMASDSVTQPPKLLQKDSVTTICIGQTVNLTGSATGGTAPYTYTWNGSTTASTYPVSPVTKTTYTLQVTDANGCTVTIHDTIKVNPKLSVVLSPPVTICSGGTATLTATPSGGDGTYSYSWQPGGASTSSINVSPATTTTYTVTLTDACGTPAVKDSVKITVLPAPVVGFTVDSLMGCYPLCANFTDITAIAGGSVIHWSWNLGDGSKDTNKTFRHCYTKSGLYTISLKITTNKGCIGYDTIKNMIDVFDHPHADFSVAPQPTTIMQPTIYFADKSTDLYGISKWLWNFEDITDSTSTVKNPVHSYMDTGVYCPTLTVTNIHGCMDSITHCLVIDPLYTLYIPDAFSPNGDGTNDYFAPRGQFFKTFDMYIFDRWGLKLYHTNDILKGWNGTYGGAICQEDTYVYLIEVIDDMSNKHSYIGKVTLLR